MGNARGSIQTRVTANFNRILSIYISMSRALSPYVRCTPSVKKKSFMRSSRPLFDSCVFYAIITSILKCKSQSVSLSNLVLYKERATVQIAYHLLLFVAMVEG